MVVCPYSNCSYSANVYSSYNAHKIRNHAGSSDFDMNIVCSEKKGTPDTPGENAEEGPAQCDSMDTFDPVEVESQCDTVWHFKSAVAPKFSITVLKDENNSSCV